jgi:hypothetical protein
VTFYDGRGAGPPKAEAFADFADQIFFPLYPKVAEIFGTSETFTAVIRPDNYIGYLGIGHSEEEIAEYFGNVFGRTLAQ